MRKLFLLTLVSVGLAALLFSACGDSVSGVCNNCPDFGPGITAEQCVSIGCRGRL